MVNLREMKGHEIAARGGVARDGVYWRVPSQAGDGVYLVDVDSTPPTCTCQDYELRGLKCKHLYAVQYHLTAQATALADVVEGATEPKQPAQPKPKRPTYRQDWPAYHLAQTTEKAHFLALLAELCQRIPEPEYVFGRPRLPYRDMVFAAAYKVYSTVSARRFMTDLGEAHAKGYLTRLPCYNSIFNYFELPELTPILHALIERSSLPMKLVETRFAVDSSGFTTCRYVRWYDAKYGQEMERHDWVKAHLMCGVNTNIVTAVEVTGAYGSDNPQFRPLVDSTAKHFTIEEVSADKAYLSRDNLEHVANYGGMPYIPFRSNSVMEGGRTSLWDALYYCFVWRRDDFLAHYHRRSLVESTFSMLKAKFGDALRSKTDVTQVNELLCKVLCHNLCCVIQSMYELGIEPEFWQTGEQ